MTDNFQSMTEYFGWQVHPFADTWRLDPPFYSERDQRIFDQAKSMLQYGKSFSVTGPSGSGKTTLVQHLLWSLDANYYRVLNIHYGGLQRSALLKVIAEQLGVETTGRAVPLLTKLQNHIVEIATSKHPVHPIIFIDDAQLLDRESLLDLCSLIVNPPKKNAAASLVIVGDEMLDKKLNLSIMTPIKTRLTVHFRMEPLSEKEIEQFILFRLKQAKAAKDLFEPDTIALIGGRCHGNRRKIMNVGTLLLSEAFYRKEKTVSSQLVTGCELLD
jgi:type II secretory pathway predicted ATPase ExeA